MFITIQIVNLDLNKYCRCGRQYGLVDLSADRTADVEGDIQSRHRAPPQHHLRDLRGADSIEKGLDKTARAKHRGAETASRTGHGAGTELRTGGQDRGQALGGLLVLLNILAT